ncbi:IS66-like element accessory protein TnpA [Roseomonas mucosa]|uniref:IS66-like element accessory protein TnpA n=1 Tax=Roseomonas mucosa TaxID=207340 RepID=UPI0023EBDAC5|nr:transposase [Roseomonas mucosa]
MLELRSSDAGAGSLAEASQFWREHITAQATSDQTQKAYCRQHGLSPRTLRNWRTRLNTVMGEVEDVTPDGLAGGKADPEEFSKASLAAPCGTRLMELITAQTTYRRQWTPDEKRQLVIEALQSGLSIERFARQRGMAPGMLYRWRGDLAGQIRAGVDLGAPVAGPARFAAVEVAGQEGGSRSAHVSASPATESEILEIRLPNGRQLRFSADLNADILRRVLAVLEGGT